MSEAAVDIQTQLEPPLAPLAPLAYELTERDREILEFERAWWKYPAVKETRVRETFAMSSTRYYQVLNWLIDQPAALEADPMTVRRLLRLRDARLAHRRAHRRA